MKRMFFVTAIAGALMCAAGRSNAVTVTVDPAHTWQGFMNVSELPSNGGAYAFGSPWGVADLTASFSGPVLTLGPNTIGDPAPYWYVGGGGPGAPGNKIMAASMYVEDNAALIGQSVTFTGTVVSNTLTSAHSTVAFIKDFAPDYSSHVPATVPITNGVFSVTLNTIPAAGRHVQFGFETVGVNVWATDVGPFGNVQVTAIPEPATAGLATLAVAAVAGLRRRRLAN
jgi:hypothetical protein